LPDENSNVERRQNAVASLLRDKPIKAASFIVTVYGDAIEPRGGVVWIGNLIEVCAQVGISETLVRTAVSRLVAAGQLIGERSGKRSFYRLTSAARVEYALAAKQLYSPEKSDVWRFIHLAGPVASDDMRTLERGGYVRLGPKMAVGCRPLPHLSKGAVIFDASLSAGSDHLRDFVSEYADLSPLDDAYRGFMERFSRIKDLLEKSMSAALPLRLLLVHEFRYIVLKDPNFPPAALPADWPGYQARRLFSELYLVLSPEAERRIGRSFINEAGPLASHNELTNQRETFLRNA